MAIEVLTITAAVPHYEMSVQLSGDTFIFEIKWNPRNSYWTLTISDPNRTQIISGVPMRVNFPILDKFDIDALPAGRLMLIDVTDKNKEAGRHDLGGDKRLMYDDLS